jgi:hypothetical protein
LRWLTYGVFGFPVAAALVAMSAKEKDPTLERRGKDELNIDSSASEPGMLLSSSKL